MSLNVDFDLKLSNYRSLKRFICLEWILKNFSTIPCNLSSTIVHCRSLPLSDGDNSDKGLIEHVIQVHMKFRRQSLINYIIKVKDSKLLPEILSHTQRLTLLSCSCLILIFLHIINYFIHYVQPEPNLVWLNRVDVVEPLVSST